MAIPDPSREAERTELAAYEAAAALESEAKRLRKAGRTVRQIALKRLPSERRDGPRWTEAEKVLSEYKISAPNPGLLLWGA